MFTHDEKKATAQEKKENQPYGRNIYLEIKNHVQKLLTQHSKLSFSEILKKEKHLIENNRYEGLYKWAFMYYFITRNSDYSYYTWFVNYIDEQTALPGQTFLSQKALCISAGRCLHIALSTLESEESKPHVVFEYLHLNHNRYVVPNSMLEVFHALYSKLTAYILLIRQRFETDFSNQYGNNKIILLYSKIATIYYSFERLSSEKDRPNFDTLKSEINLHLSIQKSNNKNSSPIGESLHNILKKIDPTKPEKSQEKERKLTEPLLPYDDEDDLSASILSPISPLIVSSLSIMQSLSTINTAGITDIETTEHAVTMKKLNKSS